MLEYGGMERIAIAIEAAYMTYDRSDIRIRSKGKRTSKM